MIKDSVLDLVGETPIVYLKKLSEKYHNNIYVKLEGGNPFGSIKDRIAKKIISSAFKDGLINQSTTIIEATSGNTGIGLAGVCLYYNLPLIIIMPNNVSNERILLLKAYHAKVILTDKKYGMKGCLDKLKEMTSTINNYFIPSQFENMNNPLTHYEITGKEITNCLSEIDGIVMGIGTGGTISGIGKYFKEKSPTTLIIGVLPKENNVIDGIGPGFIPSTLNLKVVDNIYNISRESSKQGCEELLTSEALFCGFSTGAAFIGVKKLIEEKNLVNRNILFISPDYGIKYLSKWIDE